LPDDDAETLAARILVEEHDIYPRALRLCAEGRVSMKGDRAIIDA
jgi:phosphoribosylglycinamide formyltransferase-1